MDTRMGDSANQFDLQVCEVALSRFCSRVWGVGSEILTFPYSAAAIAERSGNLTRKIRAGGQMIRAIWWSSVDTVWKPRAIPRSTDSLAGARRVLKVDSDRRGSLQDSAAGSLAESWS